MKKALVILGAAILLTVIVLFSTRSTPQPHRPLKANATHIARPVAHHAVVKATPRRPRVTAKKTPVVVRKAGVKTISRVVVKKVVRRTQAIRPLKTTQISGTKTFLLGVLVGVILIFAIFIGVGLWMDRKDRKPKSSPVPKKQKVEPPSLSSVLNRPPGETDLLPKPPATA